MGTGTFYQFCWIAHRLCMQADKKKLCREKLVSFVVQTKKICSESDADCVGRVLLASFIQLVGTIHQCCSLRNLPLPTRLATYLAMSSTRLSYAD